MKTGGKLSGLQGEAERFFGLGGLIDGTIKNSVGLSKYAKFFSRADMPAIGVIGVPDGPGGADVPELPQNHPQPVRIYSLPEQFKMAARNLSSIGDTEIHQIRASMAVTWSRDAF